MCSQLVHSPSKGRDKLNPNFTSVHAIERGGKNGRQAFEAHTLILVGPLLVVTTEKELNIEHSLPVIF